MVVINSMKPNPQDVSWDTRQS